MSDKPSVEELQSLLERSPFNSFSGAKIESIDYDTQTLVMSMPMRPEFERRALSPWHGGLLPLLSTQRGLRDGYSCRRAVPTINFRTDYLRPAINTSLTATAKFVEPEGP